jgi:predicted nucleic acid-binding protein
VIILDTNVLSELIKPVPVPQVVRWVDAHNSAEIAITSITAAELRVGVAMLPRGRRGRPMSALDVQIAAICRQHNATLATRNVTDFESAKLPVVNPWSQPND